MNRSRGTIRRTFPHEVLKYVLPFLGPLDLDASRGVCQEWRREVNHRVKRLMRIDVDSLETLQRTLARLRDPKIPFEIKCLEVVLSTNIDPYPVEDIFDLLISVPRISLGKLVIRGRYTKLQQGQLLNIIQRFQNLVHLQFGWQFRYNIRNFCITDSDSFQFYCLDKSGRVTNGPFFPVLRHLLIPGYDASLTSILNACPTLRSLSLMKLRGPYSTEGIDVDGVMLNGINLCVLDIPSLNQLKSLNLKLNKFVLERLEKIQVQVLLRLLGQFLYAQTSTLEHLDLSLEMKNIQHPLFPIPFPKLGIISIHLGLTSNLNHILDSVPTAHYLSMMPSSKETNKALPISHLIPLGISREHPEVKTITLGYEISPVELSLFGFAFKNLTDLRLQNATHGLLPTVWSQLTRLTDLFIQETEWSDEDEQDGTLRFLRDSDFILTDSASDFDI